MTFLCADVRQGHLSILVHAVAYERSVANTAFRFSLVVIMRSLGSIRFYMTTYIDDPYKSTNDVRYSMEYIGLYLPL